jgi:hypothetical protein
MRNGVKGSGVRNGVTNFNGGEEKTRKVGDKVSKKERKKGRKDKRSKIIKSNNIL